MQEQRPTWQSTRGERPRFDIWPQSAGMVNNVGGDQYFAARESFLREVAATRTKARWLVWSGVAIALLGFAVFAAGVLGFLREVSQSLGDDSAPSASPFGVEVFGVPSGLLGWAAAAVGMVLIVIGIVLHIVATSRRRTVDTRYPLPGRWSGRY